MNTKHKVKASERMKEERERKEAWARDKRERKAELRDRGGITRKRLSLHIRKIVDSIDHFKENSPLCFFDQEFEDRIEAAAEELDAVARRAIVAGFYLCSPLPRNNMLTPKSSGSFQTPLVNFPTYQTLQPVGRPRSNPSRISSYNGRQMARTEAGRRRKTRFGNRSAFRISGYGRPCWAGILR
jgi:hypothetical protein